MKILYAEDEQQISRAVTEILKIEGFDVTSVYDGGEAWGRISTGYYDAVILDIMMPVMDGIDVLEKMRNNDIFTPVLMLTAKASIDDRIKGLSVGADDYLSKPFSMKELVARINSMLRRKNQYKNEILKFGNTSLDCTTGELKSEKSSLRLSNIEVELLSFLVKNPGAIYSGEKLNEILWQNSKSADSISLYIAYLKNKLTQVCSDSSIIISDPGYIFGVKGR